jgi:hypothetical protein
MSDTYTQHIILAYKENELSCSAPLGPLVGSVGRLCPKPPFGSPSGPLSGSLSGPHLSQFFFVVLDCIAVRHGPPLGLKGINFLKCALISTLLILQVLRPWLLLDGSIA